MSCYYKIREAYDSLTNTDKTIADYILKNKRKIILMSSQALGQETKTSAAAWIRFAQHMGYKGLSALKADLTIDDDDEDIPSQCGVTQIPCRAADLRRPRLPYG